MSRFSVPGFGTSVFWGHCYFFVALKALLLQFCSALFFLCFYGTFPMGMGMWIIVIQVFIHQSDISTAVAVVSSFQGLLIEGFGNLSSLGSSFVRVLKRSLKDKQARTACAGWLCLSRGWTVFLRGPSQPGQGLWFRSGAVWAKQCLHSGTFFQGWALLWVKSPKVPLACCEQW